MGREHLTPSSSLALMSPTYSVSLTLEVLSAAPSLALPPTFKSVQAALPQTQSSSICLA